MKNTILLMALIFIFPITMGLRDYLKSRDSEDARAIGVAMARLHSRGWSNVVVSTYGVKMERGNQSVFHVFTEWKGSIKPENDIATMVPIKMED